MNFKKTTLPNGLRVIIVPTKGNPAISVLVMTQVGSKYETKKENGLSHFIEHMCFKGTPARPSSLIINKELDSLGAKSNAFTSEEFTAYYAKAEKRHWRKLLDILADIYIHPTFPKGDLEKERGVIIQEISMYEDLPQEKAAILFQSLLYGDTPVGRWIAGTKEGVSNLKHQNFIDYHRKHYVSGNTAVVVSGDIVEGVVIKEIKRLFGDISSGQRSRKESVIEEQSKPEIMIERKKSDQTHVVMGARTFKASDERNSVLKVITGILGQGMSSRLWHKLREELGACYYIYASLNEFTDHGYLAVYTGIENSRLTEVVSVIVSELKRFTQEMITAEELKKAKDYMVGRMYLGLETTDALTMFYASNLGLQKRLKTPEEIEKEIKKVTAKDVMKVAKEIFRDERLNLAVVGDVSDQRGIKKALSLK